MTEKSIERGILNVFTLLGCEFLKFSQPRHTMQSFGIPDLLILHRAKGVAFWFEVKTPHGIQSQHQQAVEALLTACGHNYRIGSTIEAIEAANEFLGVDMQLPIGERWGGKKA